MVSREWHVPPGDLFRNNLRHLFSSLLPHSWLKGNAQAQALHWKNLTNPERNKVKKLSLAGLILF